MSKKKTFGCPECGHSYDAYPPDDNHPKASSEDPKGEASGSVIKIIHDCETCKHPITLYWYRQKMSFGVA